MKKTKCEILDENNEGTGNYIEVPDHLIERAMKGWRGSGSFKVNVSLSERSHREQSGDH